MVLTLDEAEKKLGFLHHSGFECPAVGLLLTQGLAVVMQDEPSFSAWRRA